MRYKLASILTLIGFLALFKEDILTYLSVDYLKHLLLLYWPYLMILIGILLLLPNNKKT